MATGNARDLILDTAFELFYSKGYASTSFEDIARRCGITKQAITYHFGTKAELGKAVMHLFSLTTSKSFRSALTAAKGNVPEPIISAAFTIWYSSHYKSDPNFLRFFEEFVAQSPDFSSLAREEESLYFDTIGIDKNTDDIEIKIKMLSAFYAGKGLLHQYAIGLLDCTQEEFTRFLFLNYFAPFVEDDKLPELYESALQALDGVDIEVAGMFKQLDAAE